jgi:protein-tyrosine-phosphatase/DNA-binding transcriptional ArsR family regulator
MQWATVATVDEVMAGEAAVPTSGEPPSFVRLASHPVRWRLMQELVRSDRAVSELTTLVDESQSLVSYHLRQLREGGLVSVRQSSADRRDGYYSIDLASCARALRAASGSLHPALHVEVMPVPSAPAGRRRRRRVLFLCTGNSSRSQIAEALLEHLSGGAVEARSAGSHPKPLHPQAIAVMRDRGIDISTNRSKHLDEFTSQRFDEVITLCDRVREVCPEFPHHPEVAHWSIPDPALAASTGRASYRAFVRTADELETRTTLLLHRLTATPSTRRSTNAER